MVFKIKKVPAKRLDGVRPYWIFSIDIERTCDFKKTGGKIVERIDSKFNRKIAGLCRKIICSDLKNGKSCKRTKSVWKIDTVLKREIEKKMVEINDLVFDEIDYKIWHSTFKGKAKIADSWRETLVFFRKNNLKICYTFDRCAGEI